MPLALAQRLEVAGLDDALLHQVEHGLMEFLLAIALQIVDERGAELGLIRALHKAQDWAYGLLLIVVEQVEEIGLCRWWEDEIVHSLNGSKKVVKE